MPASTTITVIFVFIGIAYVRGRMGLRTTSPNRIPVWRTASFFLGLVFAWLALASPVASFDGKMLMAQMVQHLALSTFAAPLILLGAPVLSLAQAPSSLRPCGEQCAFYPVAIAPSI